ncbi:MAG: hypothetical protein ABIO91_06800 [Pyrinomonadaceae bacterium]
MGNNLNIAYCIVCEDVRPEAQGKQAILGFFGLLPDVNIKLKEIGKTLPRLAFLMNIEGDAGKYKFKFTLLGPDKKKVFDVPQLEMELLEDKSRRALAVFIVQGLTLKTEGLYTVRMANKNKAFYESTFRVDQGPEELFTT